MTSPTQSAIGFPRAAELARRDLQAIADRLPTMHDEAWWPKQPNHDRPTPTLQPGVGVDDVPGPTWDCGQGDHRVRQGWARMAQHLREAEQSSTDVLCVAVALQSRSVPVCRPTSLLDARSSVRRIQERVTALQRLWCQWAGQDTAGPTWQVDVPRSQWLATQLMGERGHPDGSPFDHIRLAMFETQRVVREVGTGKPPATCPQCRRLGSIGQPRRGGLCYSCDNQNTRMGRRQRQTTVRAWKAANRPVVAT